VIAVAGSATDAEDGDVTAGLSWESSLDGTIGSGAGFSTSVLSLGTHTITASLTDAHGAPGSDQITLTINPNTPPVVSITSPANGSSATQGSPVAFSGSATDSEDGDLTASLSWESDLDGSIGSGAGFSILVLSAGTHTITASLTDAHGAPGSDQITLIINPNTSPVVTISAPADASTAVLGDTVTFAGSANDAEDGDLTASLGHRCKRRAGQRPDHGHRQCEYAAGGDDLGTGGRQRRGPGGCRHLRRVGDGRR
jgi:hypothetical protein